MVYYANSFTLSTDENQNEVIINFRQRSPKLDDDGNIIGMTVEDIVGIVLNKSGINGLRELLSSTL